MGRDGDVKGKQEKEKGKEGNGGGREEQKTVGREIAPPILISKQHVSCVCT